MGQALFLILAALGALYLWAARHHVRRFWAARFGVDPETPGLPDYWDARLLGGSVILAGLALAMGYVAVREARMPGEVAAFLTPYPRLSSATWGPRVGATRVWTFESPSPPEKIARFHEEEAARRGWTCRRAGGGDVVSLTILRPGARVLVTASRRGSATHLAYQVEPLPSP